MAEIDLLGLLEGNVRASETAAERHSPVVPGVVVGVVSSVDDKEGLGRVRVRFSFSGRTESSWARVAVPWAGAQRRGTYFAPKRDDEVLVVFRDGKLAHPYVIGFLWSQQSPPPEASATADRSLLRSSTGNALELDDRQGKVTLRTAEGHRVVVDDQRDTIVMEIVDKDTKQTRVSIKLDGSRSKISLTAKDGSLALNAQNITVSASSQLNLTGTTVNIHGSSSVAINDPGGVTPPEPEEDS